MFESSNIIAIDIGSRCIKIMNGKPKNNGISIMDYGICDTPKNAYVEGNINSRIVIITAIQQLMEKKNFKAKNAIWGVRGSDIIIRHIEMPYMSDKQMSQAAKLEIQQYLQMDPNEYVIDSKRIGKVDSSEKRAINVLLVAAPRRKIDDYYYIAEKLGLKVKAIDLLANSVTRFFEKDKEHKLNSESTRCVGILDMGFESSNLTLIEEGRLFLERQIDIGIKDLDIMLRKAVASSPEETESIRKNIIKLDFSEKGSVSNDPRVYYSNNKAKEIIDNLIDNIIKVFDFYTSSGFNKNIECLYLYGGGSRLNGMVDYFKNSINIDVRLFSPDILSCVYNIDKELEDSFQLYVNCISLLLRKE